MSRHLERLDRVWVEHPIYFITTCTQQRRPVLATEAIHAILREVWGNCERLYGWMVGRYVVMPDHVHFFCAANGEAAALSTFIGKWKEWTAKYASRRLGMAVPLWQEEFFDHVLRSGESYEEKWLYVLANPLRAGLVGRAEDWPFIGWSGVDLELTRRLPKARPRHEDDDDLVGCHPGARHGLN